ncbi:hypothetical protein, partial [Burkholderia sp. Ac-20379]|uniref:hypothetical protein n=1 Tax=Burkholderia sp. Ac-20379 TaxID=2703900 RepID=UPI001981EEBC
TAAAASNGALRAASAAGARYGAVEAQPASRLASRVASTTARGANRRGKAEQADDTGSGPSEDIGNMAAAIVANG